ncbi:MAG: phosphoribosylamine--glycine ligase [Candidatus Spyradocola sp.]|jgi:phosphoribosylamine--glycine ligase
MDILVIGGGGREHAIIRKILESPLCGKVYCAPGNGGIAADAECVPSVKPTDIEGAVALAKEKKVDFAIVAPDDPLVLGMVDALEAAGIPAFGPHKNAAIIEGSKAFAKDLMKKYGIPTAAYEVFTDAEDAIAYVKEQNTYPTVIKADGLALGKGVLIAENEADAVAAIRDMLEGGKFGASGRRIVIEQFLSGPEVSVLALTDGKVVRPLCSSMDHKRALDGDEGLNTGGMGTIAPNPAYTDEVAKKAMERIFLPTIRAMNAEGRTFQGCLYFGLMIVDGDPYVIEYNCRFGDPETQVVLPMMEGDLLAAMIATQKGALSDAVFSTRSGAAACVVMASGGYPVKYETGKEIQGLTPDGQIPDGSATVYHAGTKRENGAYFTAGGRVLGVTARGDTLNEALTRAYRAVKGIHFDGEHYRRDIGRKAGGTYGD